jgi:hypothetical protein
MDRRELLNDEQEALRMAMDGRISSLWTALPGIIQSVDYVKRTCEVQPAIQGRVQNPDGSFQFVNLPLLVDVPIVLPSAGGFTLSLPIKTRDEVLVIFSSRCIDSWWQEGSVGVPMELRLHDLSDGFAIPGPKSVPNATPIHEENVQLTSDDGETFIEITPASEVNVKAIKFKVEAQTQADIIAPLINLVGNISAMTAPGGAQVISTSDSEITFHKVLNSTENINTTETVTGTTDVVGGGKSLNSHIHSGVSTGPNNTGGPI